MLDTGFWPNWKRVPFDLTRQFVLQMPQHKVLRSRTAYRSRNREPDFLAFLDKRLAFVSLKMRPLTGHSD